MTDKHFDSEAPKRKLVCAERRASPRAIEWLPPSKCGLPMGIFSVWVPLGAMFIMVTSGF